MVKELKNYQSQVNAYKFEIERLDKQVSSVKELYFSSKQNEVIYEDMEGENVDDQLAQQEYMQQQQMQLMRLMQVILLLMSLTILFLMEKIQIHLL